MASCRRGCLVVVLLDGAFVDGVEVTIGFLDGFFVITEIGFLVLVVLVI